MERRNNPRYRVNKNILSISEDVLAEVIDISKSGFSCKCLIRNDKQIPNITLIELLDCKLGTSVEGIPCRIVHSRKNIQDTSLSTMIMNLGLEFRNLTPSQDELVDQFIHASVLSSPVSLNGKNGGAHNWV